MTTAHPIALLEQAVEHFFAGPGAAWADAPGVVAFSGGADSTALVAVLAARSRVDGRRLVAAHLDHGLDEGSAARALAAATAARRLGLPFRTARRPPAAGDHAMAGIEAAARRRRYRFLAEVAEREGATWVATAHHRDDQAETVLLRLLFGTGIEGLGGIRAVRDLAPGVALLRPFLEVDRARIVEALVEAGRGWTEDPTNADPSVSRNRVRHLLLPRLAADCGLPPEGLVVRLAELAGVATRSAGSLARGLARHLDLRAAEPLATDGASLDLESVAVLPGELLPAALALLHRTAGLPYPPPAAARRELARQLRERSADHPAPARRPLSCDAGGGWRWRDEEGRLTVRRVAGASEVARFSYTLTVPGELEVAELGLRLRVEQRLTAAWMFEGRRQCAGLALPLVPGDRVVIRNRRRGDRLRPLGATGTRHLKELLIDHRVPRRQRDRLPLLCLGADGDQIAWVPGVTIADRYRLGDDGGQTPVWVAEILPSSSPAELVTAGVLRGIGDSEQPLVEARS
ncbi:MAG TPA: tRNA lysidine(34) synthetase TilS [Thermoanaerobaculia bacterium]|nr:tRNA lysidine(34) synthetase TilS [Thermoanaerobaculia bacterium]